LSEDTECPTSVKHRVERLVTYFERIARTIMPSNNKKFHLFCIGHEEIFCDLLEESLGIGTENNSGPDYGENMTLNIQKSKPGNDALISVKIGEKEARLRFNREQRRFYRTY
jgi:hypothetical protein